MINTKLESLVIDLSCQIKKDPLEQAQETLRLTKYVTSEIISATAKVTSITRLKGHPATIKGLKMTGGSVIENYEIIYDSYGERHTATYSKKEFYDL
ncbi:MAG TPA: hypothetical protein VJC39_02660 [Candidatus Nanoarchaeia archaeon]|nr:hypothetical protein [Candidatus Nanoarchaeia archaeon]